MLSQWIEDHQVLLYWLTGASVVVCVATLIIAPAMIVRIPADYFTHARRPRDQSDTRGSRGVALRIGKNVLGYVLIIAGIAMLVLPGQGVLVVLLGLFMVDFPGKYRVEKWLIARPRVLRGINWLRRRRGRAPLQPPSKVKDTKGR